MLIFLPVNAVRLPRISSLLKAPTVVHPIPSGSPCVFRHRAQRQVKELLRAKVDTGSFLARAASTGKKEMFEAVLAEVKKKLSDGHQVPHRSLSSLFYVVTEYPRTASRPVSGYI